MFSIGTKRLIKRFIAAMVKPYSGRQNRKLSIILNYHSINPAHKFATKPEDFLLQMEYLVSNFTVVSLLDFYEMRITKRAFPDKLAVVTFDDGYEDNYEYAFPILKKYGIKACIFLTTGFINGEIDITQKHIAYRGLKALKWDQILEMREKCITFGAHTHTHPILTEISLENAEKEIVQSKKILEEKLDEPVELFAYPLGQPKTFNSSIIKLLKRHRFKLACSTLWGSDNTNVDLFSLHRIRIDAIDTFNDFKEKINGNWIFIKWVQTLKRCL